jgi:hypothetical protein
MSWARINKDPIVNKYANRVHTRSFLSIGPILFLIAPIFAQALPKVEVTVSFIPLDERFDESLQKICKLPELGLWPYYRLIVQVVFGRMELLRIDYGPAGAQC